MRVVFLGTSGGLPTPSRSLPSIALVREGEMMLFDCGEGAQTQIMRKGLGFGRLTKIFVTHIHGDHISGLMGLIMTMSLLERTEPLDLYGPPEIGAYFKSLERDINLRSRFKLNIHEVTTGVFLREEEYHIEAVKIPHSAPCFGYALQEKVRPGRFNIERAKELGVPEGPMFGKLQKGESVTVADGRVVSPADVLGPPRPGRRVVCLTDTIYNPPIVSFCRDADLLIHEAMFASDLEDEARNKKHSTAAQAATIAREANVKQLALTHISARYLDSSPLKDEARKIFPGAKVARDLMEIEIPYRDE